MRLRRSEKDMFGRPPPRTPASPPERRLGIRQGWIPPGLVPFVPVIAIVLFLIATLITPWLGLALLVVLIASAMWLRYRDVKDIDYATLRRSNPWARAWDSFLRGRRD